MRVCVLSACRRYGLTHSTASVAGQTRDPPSSKPPLVEQLHPQPYCPPPPPLLAPSLSSSPRISSSGDDFDKLLQLLQVKSTRVTHVESIPLTCTYPTPFARGRCAHRQTSGKPNDTVVAPRTCIVARVQASHHDTDLVAALRVDSSEVWEGKQTVWSCDGDNRSVVECPVAAARSKHPVNLSGQPVSGVNAKHRRVVC